ncbi:MAG: hypothetical protein ACI37O_04275 [Candidatus Avelusimicrobium sp.]|uniref:LPD3 domain-containing protein n=1 Tax=Candidatus Avelusimicrobium sp. TaxID=3048833 RepID=UPI003EFC1B84
MQNTPKRNSFFIPEGKYAVNTTALNPRAVEQEAAVLLAGKARDSFYGLVPLDTTAEEDTRNAALTLAKGVASAGAEMLVLTPYRQIKTLWRLADDRMAKGRAFWDEVRQMPQGPDALEAADFLTQRMPDLEKRYDAARERSLQAVRNTRKKQERFLKTMHLRQDEKDNPYVYMFGAGAGSLGASVLGGIYFKAPKAVSVLFGLNQAQSAWEEAAENGVPRAKAAGVALLAGLAEALLESVGLGRLERAFEASKGVKRVLGSALTEFLQEGSQQTAEETIMQTMGGRAQSAFETFQSIALSAVMGAVLGGGAGAIHSAFFSGAKQFEKLGADKQTARALAAKAVEAGTSPQMAEEAARITEDQENPVNWPDNDIIKGQEELRTAAQKRDFAKEYDEIEARAKNKFKEVGLSDEEAALGAAVEKNIVKMQAAHLGLTPELAEKSLEISFNQELSESDAKIRFIGEMETMSAAEQKAFYKTSKMTSYKEMLGELAAFRAGLNEETAPVLDSGSTAGMTAKTDSRQQPSGMTEGVPSVGTAQEEETSLQTGNEELSEENIFDLQTKTHDYSYDKPLERGQTRNKQISITREEGSQVGRTVTFRFSKEQKSSKSDLVGERQVSATEDNNILSWLEIPDEGQREIAADAHKVNIKRIVLVENPGNMHGFKGMYAVVEYEAVGSKHLGTTKGIEADYTMLGKPTPALFKKLSGELKTAQKGKKKENGQTVTFAQGENKNTSVLNKRPLTTRAGGPAVAGKNVSIIPVKADKAVPHFDKTAQLRDYIFNVLNVLGDVEIKATKTTIHFGRQQIRRGLKRGRSDTHNQFFADVKNAVANAQYAGFEIADSEHPDVSGQDVYYTALRIGTNVYAVELKADVLLNQKGNSFDYAGHKVTKIEDGKRPGSSPVLQPSSAISINQFDEIFKRAPTSAHLSTLTQGPSANSIGNKEGNVKAETYKQDVRGKTAITSKDGFIRAVITAGQAADKSTFVHEMAHIYLSAFQHVYGMEEYTAQRKHLDAWLGKPRGGVYSRAQQEKFAEGFEQFLKEGKAPVPYLKSIFEKFRAWIIRVYDGADVSKLSAAAREAYADMFRSEAADAQHTVEFCQNAKKDYGRIRATLEKIKQNKIDVKDLDGVDVEALRDFIGILKKPAPALPKRHLLTDLRRYGAQYANSGRIDKEAYKNARVYDKQTGVGDKPADWLVKHGYMEDAEVNTYEEAQAREEEACGLIERALSGEPVYRLEDRARVELHNAYREAVNMAEDAIGADYKNYEKLLESMDALVKQGYRVVEKSDLAFMEEKFEELANLRESEAFLAQEESFGRVDDARRGSADERRKEKVQKARLENLRKAQGLKKAVLAELGKRNLDGKENILEELEKAKTVEDIYKGIDHALTAIEDAYGNSEAGKAEAGRMAPPAQDWDARRVELLKELSEINQKTDDNAAWAFAAIERDGLIVPHKNGLTPEEWNVPAAVSEKQRKMNVWKAEQILDEQLRNRYYKAFEKALGKIEGLKAPQKSIVLREFNNIRYRNKNVPELIVKTLESARQYVEKNYKAYMAGKIADMIKTPLFEKSGSLRTAKYSPAAQEFLKAAHRIVTLDEQTAQDSYAHAVQNQNYDEALTKAQVLQNRLLQLRAAPETMTAAEVQELYNDVNELRKAGRDEVRLEKFLRNTREDIMREWLITALAKQKTVLGAVTYVKKLANWQSILNTLFGELEVDALYENNTAGADRKEIVALNSQKEMNGRSAEEFKNDMLKLLLSLRHTKVFNNSIEKDIEFRISGIKKYKSFFADDKKHILVPYLSKVLEVATFEKYDSYTPDTEPNIRAYYKADEVISIDNVKYDLQLTLKEDDKGNFFWDAQVKEEGSSHYTGNKSGSKEPIDSIEVKESKVKPQTKLGKKKIKFMDALSLEQNQIQMQNHVRELRRRVVERFGEAYGIKNGNEYIKKINELQSETYTLDNYGEIPEGPQELLTERQRKPFKQTITKLELMFFYIQDQNPLNRARLQRAYREEQYASLFAPLSAADKKACAALMEIAQSTYGQMNEVHKRERGFTLGRVENYFPNRTERLTGGLDYLREMLASNAAPSAIKARVQTVLAVEKPVNPVSLLMGEISRNAEYIYGAESAGKLRRIFRDKQMARALEEKFGKQDGRDIYEHIIKMIDLNGPGARIAEKSQFFETMEFLFNNWVKSAIGLKPIVAVKQFASAFNYAENMPVAAWTKGFKDALAHPQETLRFMQEFSPYLVTRYEEGGMNETLGRALSKDDTFGTADKINTLTNAITVNVRLGDKFALAFGGKPYVDWLMKEKGYTKEAARAAFELATVRSQQANLKSTLNEAQLNGGNLFWRAAWAFRNQQMQYARKLFDAYADWKNGYISDGDMAKKVFMYAIVQPALYTLLSLGWFAADDDDRKDDWWRLAASPVEQTLGAVPFGDDLTDLLFANLRSLCADGKLSGMRSYELPGIVDMTRSFNKFVKNFNAGDADLNDWLDTLAEIGQFSGFGTKQIKTQLGGVKDALTGKPVKGGMKIIGYTDNRAKKVTGDEDE